MTRRHPVQAAAPIRCRWQQEKDVIPFILRWLEKQQKEQKTQVSAAPASEGPSDELEEVRALMPANSGGSKAVGAGRSRSVDYTP